MNVMKYIKLYHVFRRNLNFIKSNFGIFSVLQLLHILVYCEKYILLGYGANQ